MELSPIETIYKGYRFRSRLEARWAIFLDHCAIRWTYESESYRLPSGLYLPDFDLVDLGTFLEVKPATLYPGPLWEMPTTGVDKRCPWVCRKAMELGHNIRTTILVFGDPYGYGTGETHVYWFAGDEDEMAEIFSHWRNNPNAALFARQARFDRGQTPRAPVGLPRFTGKYRDATERAIDNIPF